MLEGRLPVSLVSLLLFGRDVVFRKPECRLPSNAEMSMRVRLEVVFRGPECRLSFYAGVLEVVFRIPECRPPSSAEMLTWESRGRLSSVARNVILHPLWRC